MYSSVNKRFLVINSFRLILFVFAVSFPLCLYSQVDTKFWFVAPEISNDHADRPVYFNITTFDQAARVTISMPSNSSFPDINLTIGANSTHRENLTSYIDIVENIYRTDYDLTIPGKNNNGILIESDVDITVYYESAGPNNSDLFALKGRNALGSHFFTPFQNRYYNNSASGWDDPAYSAFDVVFTEDNTYITLNIPSGQAVYNNGAGWTGTVRLGPFNRGETFSGIPVWITNGIKPSKNGNDIFGRVAQDHLSGLEIKAHDISGSSTKRIAVTLKDDSMRGFMGSAYDTGGDQIVPVDIIGKEYIALKGELRNGSVGGHYSKPPAPNSTEQEAVFITATADNTSITVRGNLETTIDKGETYTLELKHDNTHILASEPVYVWQVTGFGDEMGSAILPAIDRCTGSQKVAFTRSQSGWDFYLTILVRDGAEDNFLLNGVTNNILKASNFKNVNGTSFWKAATIGPVSTSDILELQQNVIENTSEYFHVGIIMGSNSGCRCGYFSDFGETPQIEGAPLVDGLALCAGSMELSVEDQGAYTSYQWYKNNIAINGESNSSYLVDAPGRYKVTAITTCNGVTTETFPSNEIDAIPCISIDDPVVTEGTSNTIFTVSITDQLTEDVTFEYQTYASTAQKTKDFVSSKGTATIYAGTDSCEILVPIVQDIINEPNESFEMRIRNAENVNISDSSGICTILDDGDSEPVLDLNATVTVEENVAGGNVHIPINLSEESGYTITADYAVYDITTTRNKDYVSEQTGTISITSGEKSGNISIEITNDDIFEPSTDGYESFLIIFDNIQHAQTGMDTTECRIVENDPIPELTVYSSTATEGDTLKFHAVINRMCSEEISFSAEAQDVTTSIFSDYEYTPAIQTFTIPADNAETFIFIPVNEDLLAEGNEMFTLEISNPVNATIAADPLQVTGNITDQDGLPQVYVDDVSATEGDTLKFNIKLSLTSSSDITFDVATIDGTSGNTDYESIATPIKQTISAGTSSLIVNIPSTQDTDEEGNETFQLELTNLTGDAAFLDSLAIGTIIDDDETPIAHDDNYTLNEDPSSPATGNVMDNDEGLGDTPVTITLLMDVQHGSLNLQNDASFSYTPDSNFFGSDSFKYILTDNDGDADTATVFLQIISVNDVPETADDTYTVKEKTNPAYVEITGNILDNDTGLGDTVSIIQLTAPSKGTLNLLPDGSFSYEPAEQQYGNDVFTYKLKDSNNDESDVATVSINIQYYNDEAPVAANDNYSTAQNNAIEINVLANDTDTDGNVTIDKGSIQISQQPANGSVNMDIFTGMITYTPDSGYSGNDLFIYTVADKHISLQPVKRSNEATVSIEVTTNNNAPEARCKNISAYLDEDGSATINAAALDDGSFDPDVDDTISLSIDGNATINFNCSDKGFNNVYLTVTDNHLSQSTCLSQISVLDTIPPEVAQCLKDTIVYCGPKASGAAVTYETSLFSDNCDGTNINGTLITGSPPGSTFPVGNTVVEYQYQDVSGNEPASCSFTITIVPDTVAPVITGLSSKSVMVNQLDNTYSHTGNSLDVIASDNVEVSSITHNYGSGGSSLDHFTFSEGEHTVIWTALDIFGNQSSHAFTLTVTPMFSVSLSSDMTDNEACIDEIVTFTATITGGKLPLQFSWYVDGTDMTGWITESTFSTSALTDGQVVSVIVKDGDGYQYESNLLTVSILPVPVSGNLFRKSNK
jgi:hypothetical protein